MAIAIAPAAPIVPTRLDNACCVSDVNRYYTVWYIIARTSPDIKVAIRTDVNCSVYK